MGVFLRSEKAVLRVRNPGNLLVSFYKNNISLKVIDHSHVWKACDSFREKLTAHDIKIISYQCCL